MRRALRVAAAAIAVSTAAVVAAATAAGPAAGAAVRASSVSHGAGAQPPGGSQLWRAVYGKRLGGSAAAVAVSPDSSRVYVTGSAGGRIATVAYQAATGKALWVASYHGPAHTSSGASALAVSPGGRQVFVIGNYIGRHTRNGVTLAYNAATGATMWTSVDPNGRLVFARSIAVSPDGSTVFSVGSDGNGMVTIAYAAASGATGWSQYYTGPQVGGGAYAVAVSPDGSTVFVTGFVGTDQTGEDTEYATVAYQAGTGTMRWAQVLNGASGSLGDESAGRSIAVSPDGSTVFVTGYLSTTAGDSYGTLADDASTGTRQWLELYQTSSNQNEPAALAVSPDGQQVFVTGSAGGSAGTVGYDAATGAQRWADLYHPAQGAAGAAVTVSPDSTTVFVTGSSSKAHQSTHYATFAYAAASGKKLWRQFYPGPRYPTGLGEGSAVAVSPDGSAVFVTGLLQNPLNKPSEYGTFAYQP